LDELRILYNIAMGKARTASRTAWVRELFEREILGIQRREEKEEEGVLSVLKSMIRRLLIGGR